MDPAEEEQEEGQLMKPMLSPDQPAATCDQSSKLNGAGVKTEDKTAGAARGKWDTPVEFILSCLSFAVGLGNIWRFPYLCYQNGGGAFLIPYFISLFCMGLPIFLFEMGAGQFCSQGPIRLWSMCPLFEGIGYGMMMVSGYIAIYYNILISWAFFYFFSSFSWTLPWSSCDNSWNSAQCRDDHLDTGPDTANMSAVEAPSNHTSYSSPSDEFFHLKMLGLSAGISDLTTVRWELAGCLLLAWVIVYCALWKGVKSIGKFVYVTALFPYVILLTLLVRAATLPGFLDGVTYYITPQWGRILDFNVWAAACTQIFFSIGVTWGVVITLASYNDFHNNVYRDAVIVAIGNCVTSVFAGFVIFGIIGYMAHELGAKVEEVVTQGVGLAFIAYPEAVAKMPISPLWSVLFFLMLLLLGFGTQISTTETVVTILLDQFPACRGTNRKWVTLGVCGVMFLAGLSMTTDAGIYIFQLVDNHAATYSALMLGAAEVTAMAWVYGADTFMEDLHSMLGFYPWPKIFWLWSWKIVSPALLLVILFTTAISYEDTTYRGTVYPGWASVLGWLLTLSSVVLVPGLAIARALRLGGGWRQLLSPTQDWRSRREAEIGKS